MANFPGSVSTINQLHTGVNNISTLLSGDHNSIVTTITVSSTIGFPAVGAITINVERISYTSIDGTHFLGCTRGFGGTTAISHIDQTSVQQTYGAEYHNDVRDEVIAIEAYLFAAPFVDLTTNQTINGHKNFSNPILAADGSFSSPSIAFNSQPNTGFYIHGSDNIGIVTGGGERMKVTLSQVDIINEIPLYINKNESQLVLSGGDFGNRLTINAPAYLFPASRTYTIGDMGQDANFVLDKGSQPIGGLKTFDQLALQLDAADPISPVEGQMWYNSTSKQFKGYNGTSVVILG